MGQGLIAHFVDLLLFLLNNPANVILDLLRNYF
jgi:hypothetical protein